MAKQALIILGVVLVFGILVPRFKGLDFLDPVIIVVYACISLLFVGPAAAEIFGQPASSLPPAELLSKMALILAYGWGTSVLMLISGIVTVNLAQWHGHMLLPPSALLACALLLGLTASIAVISGTALLARRNGPRAAKTVLRFSFLILLLIVAFGFRHLPADWRTALNRHLTTRGIEHMSLVASALFAVLGAVQVPRLLKIRASR